MVVDAVIKMPSHCVGCGRCSSECRVIVLVVDAVHQNTESSCWLWTLFMRMPSHRVGCGRCPSECRVVVLVVDAVHQNAES